MSCLTPDIIYKAIIHPAEISLNCDFILNHLVQPTEFHLNSYLSAFLLTCLLEAPFYLWAFRFSLLFKSITLLFIANIITHPIIYFLLPWFFSLLKMNTLSFIVIAEIFAPITEAIILWRFAKLPIGRALIMMILANIFSWYIGAWLLT